LSETAPEGGTLEDRVERLEGGQNRILSKLDELIGGVHQRAEAGTEQRLGRPSTVEEQVQAELARRDKEAAEKASRDEQASEVKTLRQRIAELAEKPPEQPQPRRQRVMWGGR